MRSRTKPCAWRCSGWSRCGRAVVDCPARRERLVLATKFSGNLYPGDPNGGGSSRKSIFAACEHSLRRLQTDYIDLYWLHNWDKHTPIEETMSALQDLVQSGKVRPIAIASERPFPGMPDLQPIKDSLPGVALCDDEIE